MCELKTFERWSFTLVIMPVISPTQPHLTFKNITDIVLGYLYNKADHLQVRLYKV